MTTRHQKAEFYLIVAGLFAAFFYFVFRALVWDYIIWLGIVPALGFYYAASIWPRFLDYRFNTLDKLLLVYFIYGVAITAFSLLFMGFGKTLVVQLGIHYYAPTILYFLARHYTRNSVPNVMRVTRIFWIIAIVLIVDIAIEFYVTDILNDPLAIPWKKAQVENSELFNPERSVLLDDPSTIDLRRWSHQDFHAPQTIMNGRKPGGMALAMLFAFILPFFAMSLSGLRKVSSGKSWHLNPVTSGAILSALIFWAFVLLNKTTLAATVLVFLAGLIMMRSPRLALWSGLIVVSVGLFYGPLVRTLVKENFFERPHASPTGQPRTRLVHTTDLRPIVSAYLNTPIDVTFFGHHALPGRYTVEYNSSTRVKEGLGGLTLPIRLGIGWGIITTAGLITAAAYSLTLTKTRALKVFGFAFLGLLFIYVTDLHDPSSIRPGAYEVIMVALGCLSSLREIVRDDKDSHVESEAIPELDRVP